MLNILLFGPPGAGKGTQAERIKEKYRLVHLSTGDILRGELKAKTELGREAQKYMDKGELVPDEVVIGMIDNKLKENSGANGFIFDGFPRTTAQAKALDELLEKSASPISTMISLEVQHDELVKRLQKRAEVSGRADDKDISVIENRIQVYHNETAPLKDYYKAQGKYTPIDGMGSIEDIFGRVCTVLDEL